MMVIGLGESSTIDVNPCQDYTEVEFNENTIIVYGDHENGSLTYNEHTYYLQANVEMVDVSTGAYKAENSGYYYLAINVDNSYIYTLESENEGDLTYSDIISNSDYSSDYSDVSNNGTRKLSYNGGYIYLFGEDKLYYNGNVYYKITDSGSGEEPGGEEPGDEPEVLFTLIYETPYEGDDGSYTFYENGNVSFVGDDSFDGTWTLDGSTLWITPYGSDTLEYTVNSNTEIYDKEFQRTYTVDINS